MQERSKPMDVDAYIAGAAQEARPILRDLRHIITSTVPAAEEGISWNVPFYKYHGALAGFAVYKSHVSFGTGGAELPGEVREMLENKGYHTGQKTVQIQFDQQVPAKEIQAILRAQAKINEAKTTNK